LINREIDAGQRFMSAGVAFGDLAEADHVWGGIKR
jgi:hypothetical protein